MENKHLPQRPAQHVIGEEGVSILRKSLPPQWILREISPDYGLDCEIEIIGRNGSMTGALIKAQVKATAGSEMSASIRTETVRYWLMMPIPVILIRVFINTSKILWLDVRFYLEEFNKLDSFYNTNIRSITFNFKYAHLLSQSLNQLENLGIEHQENAVMSPEEMLSQNNGHFVGVCLLVYLFNGEPENFLQYLRKYGSDEQIIDDFPFVVWLKKIIKEDHDVVNRIKEKIIPGGWNSEKEEESRKRFEELQLTKPLDLLLNNISE